MHRTILTATALAAGALLGTSTALALDAPAEPARAAQAAPGPPTGDAAGIDLARKANSHYATPARLSLRMRGSVSGGVIDLRFTLQRGKARRMVMTVAIGGERVTIVQTLTGIFERSGGTRCWRRSGSTVPGPDGQMIVLPGSRVFAPEPIGSLQRLEVLERDPATGKRARIAYKIDPLTGRIATMVADGIAFNFRTLPRPPVIPSPTPRC